MVVLVRSLPFEASEIGFQVLLELWSRLGIP